MDNIFWVVALVVIAGIGMSILDQISKKKNNTKRNINNTKRNINNRKKQSFVKSNVNNFYKENRLKGRDGEQKFKDLIIELGFSYISVEQSKYTWFEEFKRPDFIIGSDTTESVNTIKPPYAFEVKNHSINNDLNYQAYKLSAQEVEGLKKFSLFMNMPVYLSFYNNDKSCFYFISLQDFIDNKFNKGDQYYVALKRFIAIENKSKFIEFLKQDK